MSQAKANDDNVRDEVVVSANGVALPNRTDVRVESLLRDEGVVVEGPTLAEQFADVIGTVPDLPADLAAQHDHDLVRSTQAMTRGFADSYFFCLYVVLAIQKESTMVSDDLRLVSALATGPLKGRVAWLGATR